MISFEKASQSQCFSFFEAVNRIEVRIDGASTVYAGGGDVGEVAARRVFGKHFHDRFLVGREEQSEKKFVEIVELLETLLRFVRIDCVRS